MGKHNPFEEKSESTTKLVYFKLFAIVLFSLFFLKA